jgi:hypothetical protein
VVKIRKGEEWLSKKNLKSVVKTLKKVKELIKQGNIRKITISDKEGKVIASFPLTVGVVGVVIAPVLAAVGAIAALVSECTISVERA